MDFSRTAWSYLIGRKLNRQQLLSPTRISSRGAATLSVVIRAGCAVCVARTVRALGNDRPTWYVLATAIIFAEDSAVPSGIDARNCLVDTSSVRTDESTASTNYRISRGCERRGVVELHRAIVKCG